MKKENLSTELMIAASQSSKEKKYWLEHFSGELVKSCFPFDHNKKNSRERRLETKKIQFSQRLFNRLLALSNQSIPRLHMIVTAGVVALLHRWTDNRDIIVGIPIDKQEREGNFINTVLPLRNRVDVGTTFKELLIQVRDTINGALANQNYPIERLLNDLNIAELTDDFPLFDVAVLMENIQEKSYLDHVKPGMTFCFLKTDRSIEGKLEYNRSVYTPATIEQIITHLTNLLEEALFNVDIEVDRINLLSEEETRQLMVQFNSTESEYPEDKTLYELVTQQVEKEPGHIAVVFNRRQLTYGELEEKSNRLAGELRRKSMGPGNIIAIMVDISLEMVTGILGILKSGAAYLPIDTNYPLERKKYMLKDSNPVLLLTGPAYTDGLDYRGEIMEIGKEELYTGSGTGPGKIGRSDDTAYVIYTSGSTGIPKGTAVRHNNITNQIYGLAKMYPFDGSHTHILLAPYTFDPSVQQIFLPITTGGKLYLVSQATKNDVSRLLGFIVSKGINIINTVPSLMSVLVREITAGANLCLKYVILAGETFSRDLYNHINEALTVETIINIYGPTEATINTTLYECLPGEPGETIPIGKPLMNYQVWILDEQLNLLPPGVPGEICISGKGVAAGYLNQPTLTKEKFVENKFDPGNCIYRTGDRGKWRRDGNIEFLGRIDNQVKMRGFRIEPSEIENQLQGYKGIRNAVVLAQGEESLNKYLVAYVVPEIPGKTIALDDLKGYLAGKFPDYMVPAYYMQIEKIPLTLNGKIDRKALPGIETKTDETYTAPNNPLGKKLVQIWSQVLELEPGSIGTEQEFFDLGGHSLKATLLVSKIHREFNVKLALTEVFINPTIRGLTNLIKKGKEDKFIPIEPVEKKEYYPLSSAQKRIYLLHQLGGDLTVYNVSIALHVEGEISGEKLKKTANMLIKRHENLRTSFRLIKGELAQQIHEKPDFKIVYLEAKEKQVDENIRAFVRPFDPGTAPLLRMGLIKMGKARWMMILDIHHIITDGVSMDVIVRDFMTLYEEKDFSPLRIHYKDYSAWQNTDKESMTLKRQEEYWQEVFALTQPALNLPTDYPRPLKQSFEGDIVHFQLEPGMTRGLEKIVTGEDTTLYIVLLAIYNIFLGKICGQEDIVVGTPIAGRRHMDLEEVVGLFINTLALRNYPCRGKTFVMFLREVKARTLEMFENQDYPFDQLVNKVTIDKDLGRNPLFDTQFNLYNIDTAEFVIPGMKITPYRFSNKISRFDLALSGIEKDGGLYMTFEYCTRLLKKETLQQLIRCFKELTADAIKHPNKTIAKMKILPEREKERILYDFNKTGAAGPWEKTLHGLYEEQVSKTPGAVAVVETEPGASTTYGQLNRGAQRLAWVLKEKGLQEEDIVAIMVERSMDMITGILAILKAGGAYLPLTAKLPRERVQYMLRDSGAPILISRGDSLNPRQHPSYEQKIIDIRDESIYQGKPAPLETAAGTTPGSPAYVIYTSGSTGKPKAVIVEHRNVVQLIQHSNYIDFNPGDRLLLTGEIIFDITTFEIWGPLLNGLELYLANESTIMDADKLGRLIAGNKISILHLIPQLFNRLAARRLNIFAGLNYFLVGGDLVRPRYINRLRNSIKDIKILHMYGPTENTTFSTFHPVERDHENAIPIGKPLGKTMAFIVDKTCELLPVGIPGELCLGGAGVARGYLNNPTMTNEKFQPNPFITGDRLYRSGDLARWQPDGNIEFLGRIDNQVKIRGHRIELGEIQKRLIKHEKITEALLEAAEDKDREKCIRAYIVTKMETASSLSVSEIKEYLSGYLPAYMIPAQFVKIEEIPLNINGKVDMKALRSYGEKLGTGEEYVAPGNDMEKIIAGIWQEILNKEAVGINDNFFDIGGNSLLIITIAGKLKEALELDIDLPVVTMFQYPTVHALASYLNREKTGESLSMEVQKEEEDKAMDREAESLLDTIQVFEEI